MGVGIYLHGRHDAAEPTADWLARLSDWFDEDVAADEFWGNFITRCRVGTAHDDLPALLVEVHPAGEEVEFIVPGPGRVLVSAKTSTVGPGYHTALCRLVRWFGEAFAVRWNPLSEEDDGSEDETGYFFTGDRAAVEAEMLLHLKTIATISADTLREQGYTLEAWHLPIGHRYSEYPGGVRTPLGPRSNEWVAAVAADPAAGRDIYPWWDEGLTAGFRLGRALHGLWTAVRWRPPLTDEEYDDWDFLCTDLCEAYAADPTLDYPWREWAELIDLLNEAEGATEVSDELEAVIREKAAAVPADRPLVGYRRHPVTVSLADGWTVRIPGSMTEDWDGDTWSAWDGDRTVWFSNWGLTRNDGTPVPAADALKVMKEADGDLIHHRDGDLVGKAVVRETEEDGEPLLNLQAYSAVDGKAALCNIFYHDPADFDWAGATWQSLKAPPAEAEAEAEAEADANADDP